MSYSLQTAEEVGQDIADGWAFFEDRQTGLGDRLIQEIYSTIDRVLENPFVFQKRHQEYRVALTRRFKFKIIYRIEGELVTVVAVRHPSRHPTSWRDRP